MRLCFVSLLLTSTQIRISELRRSVHLLWRSQTNIHENYKSVFGAFGDFNIQTGTSMVDQFKPWYLGMAFPFTLPSAVGSYDVPSKPRWRRPEDSERVLFYILGCSRILDYHMRSSIIRTDQLGPLVKYSFTISRVGYHKESKANTEDIGDSLLLCGIYTSENESILVLVLVSKGN